ncbi:hypothetical protein HK105_209153 [Polyrhizophydium stewartii]|uniref:Ankyrin repeat domain-containing protein n=1 Tax=Polyrhizophydium stewartii TaxID=2732419 RepID=A0ABR4MVZ6_9FUNG
MPIPVISFSSLVAQALPPPPPPPPPPALAVSAKERGMVAAPAAEDPQPLPPGASHWDHIAPELRGLIFDWAGPFTKLCAGELEPLELRGLTLEQREALWVDALTLEWEHDLRQLPRVPQHSACFFAMRTPGMFDRVRAAGLADGRVLRLVAIRRGWLDLLDTRRTQLLAEAAAEEGALWILEDLVDVRKAIRPTSELAAKAARGGRLNVLEWLDARMPLDQWTGDVLGQAAMGGHLTAVRWLCRHRTPFLQWFVVRRAAEGGHVHVLDFLYGRYRAVFDEHADRIAHGIGDVAAARWLHARGLVRAPERMLDAFVRRGSVAGVVWACNELGVHPAQHHLDAACAAGRVALARWLLAAGAARPSDAAAHAAAAARCVGALRLLAARDPAMLAAAVAAAEARHDADLLRWLRARFPAAAA